MRAAVSKETDRRSWSSFMQWMCLSADIKTLISFFWPGQWNLSPCSMFCLSSCKILLDQRTELTVWVFMCSPPGHSHLCPLSPGLLGPTGCRLVPALCCHVDAVSVLLAAGPLCGAAGGAKVFTRSRSRVWSCCCGPGGCNAALHPGNTTHKGPGE